MTYIAAIIALISASAATLIAGYMYVERHDMHAQLESLSSQVDSLRGSLGNAKQSMRRDVRKVLAEELEELEVQSEPQQSDGGMNEMMQAMMMQNLGGMMNGGNANEPETPGGDGAYSGVIGKGGSPNSED